MAHMTAAASPANESLLSHLFDPRGRSNRAKYWLGIVIWLVIYAVLAAPYFVLSEQPPAVVLGIGALLVVALIAGTVSSILFSIRRLHDRDKSGHWLWLYVAVPAVLNVAGNVVSLASPEAVFVALPLALVALGISIWMIVELGFFRGTRGPNRFGPDPLQA
jgi:uncharacterized membrane protein YhaH (DUF805 family)